jgi:CPA2 family monovalent cation:H+ antiporter-2
MTTLSAVLAASESGDVLLELGIVLIVLAVAGRLAARVGLPSIPLYLAAGLLLGEGSVLPLEASEEFIGVGADVGVVLLLLLLGLEYTPRELRSGVRSGWAAGLVDLVANSVPGLLAGLLLGWGPVAAVILAGVTYISSSGIIAKQLFDLDRLANRETPTVLTVLVLEDLAMAAFLPLVGVLLVGESLAEATSSIAVAVAAIAATFFIATRHGDRISRVLDTRSPELLLLSILGLALLIGGLAERVQVSAAVAAFLVGVALSDRVAERGRELLMPIRDVFGGLFFVFFGLQVDPAALPPVLVPAVALAVAGAVTKSATGWWAARRAGIGPRGRVRAGLSLIPRGEFSIVIAGLAVAAEVDADFGPLTTAYVLILAVFGSLAMRFADHVPLPTRRPAANAGGGAA